MLSQGQVMEIKDKLNNVPSLILEFWKIKKDILITVTNSAMCIVKVKM